MGLLDSVIGSVTGSKPHESGGTSPLTKALLLLLAAKAASSYLGRSDSSPAPAPAGADPAASGKITSGVLAGMPNLDTLLGYFRGTPHESKAQSWIAPGQNQNIQPHELQEVLGPDTLDRLQRETGLSREQLLTQLSGVLPQVVDKLTPHGRLPTPEETRRW